MATTGLRLRLRVRRLASSRVVQLAAYALAASAALSAGVSATALETDGATTYCWGETSSVRGGGDGEVASEDACPIALGLEVTLAAADQGVETVEVALSVAVAHDEWLAVACGLSGARDAVEVTAGIYRLYKPDPAAVDSEGTRFESVEVTSGRLSAWTSARVVVLRSFVPQSLELLNSTFAGRITCGGGGDDAKSAARFNFAVFGKLDRAFAVSSLGVDGGGVIPAVELSDGQALGMSSSELTIAVLVAVIMLIVVVVAVVLCVRRRSRERMKVQQGITSPVTGESNLRVSDWTEVYATHDNLPCSILQDDCTTLAILRASVVSPTRRVADFTRDVAVWDERSSASPITPGSFILDSGSCASLSPANSFVLLEASDRVSLSLHEALQELSDSEDERLEVAV